MTEIDYVVGPFDPRLPAKAVRVSGCTRLALVIWEDDDGDVEFTEYDPKTGEKVGEARHEA